MTPQILGKISLVATILVLTFVPAPFSWLAIGIQLPWWLYNSDDPLPDYVSAPELQRYAPWLATTLWYIRNPLHNFCAYVIGFKGLPVWTLGRSTTRWAEGFNWQINFVFYFLPLPFVSWRRMLEAYAGWANDGRFGLALRRRHD